MFYLVFDNNTSFAFLIVEFASQILSSHIKGLPVGKVLIEEAVTIEDVYEPYLMQIGFLARTPRGRCVTAAAYQHLGYKVPTNTAAAQGSLFDN